MTKTRSTPPHSALALLLACALLPACAGNAPPPEAPPPPPPAPVAAAPTPAPVPPPAATAAVEAPPPAAPKHHLGHHHDFAELFLASLDSLELKPDQKTAVDGIESDLEKLGDASKEPRQKLEADVADGVASGKIDHAKTDADIKVLSNAVAATEPSVQDAMNRLHKTLDADQRKKLVETVRAKGKEMHEHEGKGPDHEHEGKGPPGEHEGKGGPPGEHEGKGPGHEHEGKGPPGEHEGRGPGHEHEGPPGGPGFGDGPLAKLGEDLALTPEQKEKIRAKLEPQLKAHHAATKEKMAAAEKHLDAIGAAFESDQFDAKKAGVGTLAPDMVKAIATQRVQFVETILSVLTPEQRAKFAAHLKEHAADEDGA